MPAIIATVAARHPITTEIIMLNKSKWIPLLLRNPKSAKIEANRMSILNMELGKTTESKITLITKKGFMDIAP